MTILTTETLWDVYTDTSKLNEKNIYKWRSYLSMYAFVVVNKSIYVMGSFLQFQNIFI